MAAERFDFTNAQGERLAGLLDNPPGAPRAYALFAHCFTCGKDVHAARRIAEGLMALRLYAGHKALPLNHVTVSLTHNKIHAADCADCETKQGMLDRIERAITFMGNLDDAQRTRLLEIADRCPVHRTLTSEIDIRTTERREPV